MSHVQSINNLDQNKSLLYNAQKMPPTERRNLALESLSGKQSIKDLAKKYTVSRKFIRAQRDIAIKALDKVFNPPTKDDAVLFTIPVTRDFLKTSATSLALDCHSSERGIVQHFKNVYDYKICEATAHNILAEVAQEATIQNEKIKLGPIEIAAFDEIFQGVAPILAGCDAKTTFTFLLSKQKNRSALTWAVALLEGQENGLNPQQSVADFGQGLRAGLAMIFPNLQCDADVFHILMDLGKVKTYLENRAMGTIAKHYELEKNILRLQKQAESLSKELEKLRSKTKAKTAMVDILVQLNIFATPAPDIHCAENNIKEKSQKILALEETMMNNQKQRKELLDAHSKACIAETKIVKLVDTIETIRTWMQNDILAVAGSDHSKRLELFDFVIQALDEAEKECNSKHVRKMITKLKNQRDDLLRFVARNDIKLAAAAESLEIEMPVLRELYELQALSHENNQRWGQEQKLRAKIGERFHLALVHIKAIVEDTSRASSVVENLNSRIRPYFFLRKSFGQESLELLRFYLNHKSFTRSEHPERVGKSPAELLSGKAHPHWLEMLGLKRFKQETAQA